MFHTKIKFSITLHCWGKTKERKKAQEIEEYIQQIVYNTLAQWKLITIATLRLMKICQNCWSCDWMAQSPTEEGLFYLKNPLQKRCFGACRETWIQQCQLQGKVRNNVFLKGLVQYQNTDPWHHGSKSRSIPKGDISWFAVIVACCHMNFFYPKKYENDIQKIYNIGR